MPAAEPEHIAFRTTFPSKSLSDAAKPILWQPVDIDALQVTTFI